MNEKVGYVGTMNQGFKTKDGGQNWESIELGRACNKIKIYEKPIKETYGYSIGLDIFKLKESKESRLLEKSEKSNKSN